MKPRPDAAPLRAEPARLQTTHTELAELRKRVELQIASERGSLVWLKGRSTRARLALAAFVLAAVLWAVPSLSPRADLSLATLARLHGLLAGYLLALSVLVARLLRPIQRLDPPAYVDAGLAALGLLAPCLSLWLAAPSSPVLAPPRDCLALGSLLGGASIIWLRALMRNDPLDMRTRLLTAAAGGLLANLALELHCPATAPIHLLVGHASIGPILWFLGAGWRRLARPNGRASSLS